MESDKKLEDKNPSGVGPQIVAFSSLEEDHKEGEPRGDKSPAVVQCTPGQQIHRETRRLWRKNFTKNRIYEEEPGGVCHRCKGHRLGSQQPARHYEDGGEQPKDKF